MSNGLIDKILSLNTEAEKFNVDLFKNISLDLWTTMLAGAALIDLKGKANADGVISPEEIQVIQAQEQVLYTSIGLVAKDIVVLADVLGVGTAAATGWRGYNNLMIFIDTLDGTPLDTRPKVDIVLGIAIIADLNATISQLISGVSDIPGVGKKIPPVVKVAGELMGFASDLFTFLGNALTDSAGSGKAYIYLDGGSQPGMPDIAQTLINADYQALADAVEQRIDNIVDAMLDYVPDFSNPWADNAPEKKVFIGDQSGVATADEFSGGAVGDIAFGLDGDDSLYGHGGNDYLNGGKGNDYFDGGDGDDILVDSEGSEIYAFNTNQNYGHDTIYDIDDRGSIIIDGVIISGGEQITPYVWKSADGAYQISVVQEFDGVANSQSLIISKPDDSQNSVTVKFWKDGDLGITLEKKETPEAPTNIDTANDGNNLIVNRSTVFGLGGNDYILATNGNDYLYGDDGNDMISAKDGSDTISGGIGNDVIFGGLGRDVIFGGDGNDFILSSATLNTQRSDIEYYVGNPVSGHSDLDQDYENIDFYFTPAYSTESETYGYYIDFGSGVTTTILPIIESGFTHQGQYFYLTNYYSYLNYGVGYAGEDAVYGGEGDDFILGSRDSDALDGEEGDDNLFGLNGNDFLFGRDGEDELFGGDGLDVISGGDKADNITGGYDKDIIHGDAGNDKIQGDLSNLLGTEAPPEGVDYSRFGDDEIYGDAGDDEIVGNGGVDIIHGGDDDDSIQGDSQYLDGLLHKNDTLYGDKGNDKVLGDGGGDTIYGGEGDDQLSGDSSELEGQYHGNDTIWGNDGEDTIWGDGGADTIDGGEGNDQIQGDAITLTAANHGNDTIRGDLGDDTIWGQGGNDTIFGGDGDDSIDGDYATLAGADHGDDTIDGGAGNDGIWGRGGKDTIDGGEGDDTINGDSSDLDGASHGNDIINGGAGNDRIWAQGGSDTINGGDGNDYIEGDDASLSGQYHGNDIIDGGNGTDNIWGNGGNDTIYGGADDDALQGDSRNDRQNDGNDQLFGGSGNDNLIGYDGNDTLDGGEGDDLLFAGNGNDILISNAGNDQLTGGAGDDEYRIQVRDSKVKILDSSGDNHVYLDGAFDTSKIRIKNYTNATSIIAPGPSDDPAALFPEFQLTFFDASTTQPTVDGGVLTDEYGNVVTGGYDHYLHFTDASNGAEQAIHVETYLKEKEGLSFYLWTGSLHGVQAPFLIYTNSQINENDQLVFGGSVIGDELDISTIRTNTQNNGGTLADVYNLGGGDDIVQGSEVGDIIFGEGGDDTIYGQGGNDQLDGGEGNDVIDGKDGDDIIHAGNGNDVIDGGNGVNTLYGEAGDDTLKGGNDLDFITGGIGNDIIDGGNGANTLQGDEGNDILKGGSDVDVMSGGTGSDVLQGEAGADIYQFSQGDGSDTIIDTGLIGEESIINFNDVLASSVELIVTQNDLKIKYGSFDQILVKDFFINSSIKEIGFVDGSKWSYNDIVDQLKAVIYGTAESDDIYGVTTIKNEIHGLDGDDNLIGGNRADLIYGGAGNDIISGQAGNGDQLYGEEGWDILYASGNNNLLDGGAGGGGLYIQGNNNILKGGSGSDSFLVSGGSDNILVGGLGYDTYDILGSNGTHISESDGSGLITIDSAAIYYKYSPTSWGSSYYIDITPRVDQAELVSYSADGDYSLSQYKYTKYSHRIADLIYDATLGQLVLHKDGLSLNSQFSSFTEGFDYFKIDNLFTLNDLDLIKNLDVRLSNVNWNSGNHHTSFLTTTLSLSDFLDQGTVKSIYGAGDDVIYGLTNWLGNRLYEYGSYQQLTFGDIIYAGAGADHVYTGNGSSIVYAGDGDDYVAASDIFARDELYAGAGNDTLYTYDPTLISQPTENPYLSVYGESAWLLAGKDTIYAGDGNDTVYVGDQYADVFGEAGNDTLIAGNGGAYLDGGAGADIMHGGAGSDTFVVDDVNDQIFENADSGYDTIQIGLSVDLLSSNFINFEAVILTGTNNLFAKGNDVDNQLIGNDGNNLLDGRAGSDRMEGGLGDDYYVVDVTDTVATDEEGNSYILDGDQVLENADEGIDTLERWQDDRFIGQDANGNPVVTSSYRLLNNNIENLILMGQAKNAFGNNLDNIIVGNSQDNYSDGMKGNDTYIFAKGGGTDTLSFKDDVTATNILKIQGYNANEVVAQKQGNSVYISFKNTSDHIWLSNYSVADSTSNGITTTNKLDQIVFDSGVVWTQTDIDTLVNRVNHAPTINQNVTIPMVNASQGNAFSYTIAENAITDPDTWDSLTFKVTSNTQGSNGQYNPIPSWLTFDPVTRTLSGTPPASVSGTLTFYYWGTDLYGQGVGRSFTLKVTPPNQAPVIGIAIPDQTFADGRAFSYTIPSNSFTDPDSDAMTYQLTLADGSALPSWLTFNSSTRVLSGTSPDNTSAPITLKITARDIVGNTTSDLFDLKFTVQNLTINGTSGVDTLIGGSGNDTLTGLASNDTLKGSSGNDILDGGTGNDTLIGGTGNDIYIIDSTNDIVTENASEGTDTVQSSLTYTLGNNVENLTLLTTNAINGIGNALNNVLTGNSVVNTLTGGAGDDTLNGGAGNDKLFGGIGNDLYIIDTASDLITENADQGTDSVQSLVTYTLGNNVENLTLTGSGLISGIGNTLNNVIIGNSVANTLNGGAGNDSLIGGFGDDIYVVDSVSDLITENVNEGTDSVQSSVTYTLTANVENLTLVNTVVINGTGNALNNVLIGNSAINTLNGGDGDDTLNGGAGNDIMVGGTGNDSYTVDSTTDVITENINEGTDSVQSSVTYTLSDNVENLTLLGSSGLSGTGNSLNNVLVGNSAVNTLNGGAGDDTLNGGAGNDALKGGLGNDLYIVDSADVITENANEGIDSVQSSVTFTLATNVENLTLTTSSALNGIGNASNNVLIGNAGVNTLTGGAGDDTLDGGAGNDALKGGLGNDLYIVDSTSDVITENASEGTDSVQSFVTYTLAANVENLTLVGSSAINATGNILANILIGNSAVNTLTGAAGNDTYNLSRTSSNDSIVENDTTVGNQDVLQMTSDIRADQLWFRKVGTDLEVSVIGTSNSAMIKNWYAANQYHVELFKSGDGKTLTDVKVQNLVNAMSGMTPPASGQIDLSASYQTSLNPVLAANWT